MEKLIYLIGIIDPIIKIMGFFAFMFVGFSVISIISMTIDHIFGNVFDDIKHKRRLKKVLFVFLLPFSIILSSIALFTPNSKTIACMYVIPRIVERKNLQDVPDKMINLLNQKLDEWSKAEGK